MLPVVDLRGVWLAACVVGSLPLLAGLTATVLAAASGATAFGRLAQARHLLATLTGGTIGCLVLTGVIVGGLAVGGLERGAVGLVVAPFPAGLAAYQVARGVAATLAWSRCRVCGARFHTQGSDQCGRCADRLDRQDFERALADFPTRFRELSQGRPPSEAG